MSRAKRISVRNGWRKSRWRILPCQSAGFRKRQVCAGTLRCARIAGGRSGRAVWRKYLNAGLVGSIGAAFRPLCHVREAAIRCAQHSVSCGRRVRSGNPAKCHCGHADLSAVYFHDGRRARCFASAHVELWQAKTRRPQSWNRTSASGVGVTFSNAVTEVVLADNAVVDHYKITQMGDVSYHIGTMQILLAHSSNFSLRTTSHWTVRLYGTMQTPSSRPKAANVR